MIVQGFDVEFDFTVAHSARDCEGATALTYTLTPGGAAARITVECDRIGCKPVIVMLHLRESERAR